MQVESKFLITLVPAHPHWKKSTKEKSNGKKDYD
jgi:hypothetical protein